MKKTIVFVCLMLFFAACSKVEIKKTSRFSVPASIAKIIAKQATPYYLNRGRENMSNAKITTDTTRAIDSMFVINDVNGDTALFVFTYVNNGGFIVISADTRYNPICAFTDQGTLRNSTLPAGLVMWFDKTVENIEMVRSGQYDNSEEADIEWESALQTLELFDNGDVKNWFVSADPVTREPNPRHCNSWTGTVGPLLQTAWNQNVGFNDLCPNGNCPYTGNGHMPAGCVATAAGQVLKFYNKTNNYNINYSIMPNGSSGNLEVQKLMYTLGIWINLNMQYACDGSGSQTSSIPAMIKNRFGFSSAQYGSYNNTTNVSYDLNHGRPVILDGCATISSINVLSIFSIRVPDNCHAWVCDGYYYIEDDCGHKIMTNYHMNWGWYSGFNGPYYMTNWNVNGSNFQYAQGQCYNMY